MAPDCAQPRLAVCLKRSGSDGRSTWHLANRHSPRPDARSGRRLGKASLAIFSADALSSNPALPGAEKALASGVRGNMVESDFALGHVLIARPATSAELQFQKLAGPHQRSNFRTRRLVCLNPKVEQTFRDGVLGSSEDRGCFQSNHEFPMRFCTRTKRRFDASTVQGRLQDALTTAGEGEPSHGCRRAFQP